MMNKINKWLQELLTYLIIFLFTGITTSAQSNVVNKYGLYVVNDVKLLSREMASDSNKQMINLQKAIPALILDLKYATIHNFMRRKLYPPVRTTYLRLPAVTALKKVIAELKSQNLTIKIFDAYRPYSVTEEMWEAVKDDRYAADPSKGSGHNRGIAVDLTLINLQTKKELSMGTGFDNFSDTAHQDFSGLPGKILENRLLLKITMEKYGFIYLETEWWHFSLPNANTFELLDVTFKELKELNY
ncbi:MAG: M15 family metallopeptidase [Ginsengibacter sp.]